MNEQAHAWVVLRLDYDDEDDARCVEAALAPENGPHCRSQREGTVLVIEVPSGTLGRVAATLDDLLACASAAERARSAAADQ